MKVSSFVASVAVTAAATLPLAGVASAQDLNCLVDFGGDHARAQAELEKDPSDPHGLDRDKNGIACEVLLNGSGSPSGGGTSNNTSTSDDGEDDDGEDDGEDDDGERQVSVVPQGGVETGDGTGTDLADPVAIGLGALAAMGVAAAVARRPAHGPR